MKRPQDKPTGKELHDKHANADTDQNKNINTDMLHNYLQILPLVGVDIVGTIDSEDSKY